MESAGTLVLRCGPGRHPRVLWTWEPFRQACGDERYIVTDPDVVPSDDIPGDWPDVLGDALDRSGRPKAGLSLRLDRIPEHYQRRAKVLDWEAQFWDTDTERRPVRRRDRHHPRAVPAAHRAIHVQPVRRYAPRRRTRRTTSPGTRTSPTCLPR